MKLLSPSSRSTLYILWFVMVEQGPCKLGCFLSAGFLLLVPVEAMGGRLDDKVRGEGASSFLRAPSNDPYPSSRSGSGLHFLSSLLEEPLGLPIRTSTTGSTLPQRDEF